MSAHDDPVADALGRLLAGHATAPGHAAAAWPTPLWQAVEDAGFTAALVPESAGGSGLAFGDAGALMMLAGEHAAPVPLAEGMLAHWLLARAGLAAPVGTATIAAGLQPLQLAGDGTGVRASGTLPRVPWGADSDHVVGLGLGDAGLRVVMIATRGTGVRIAPGHSIAGEPRDTLVLRDAPVAGHAAAPLSPADWLAIAAAARAAQMAGALGAVLRQAIAYANLRRQFGRPLSGFQAIQQQLAVLAAQSAAAGAAAQAGMEALDELTRAGTAADAIANDLAVTSAKVRAGEAAGRGAAISHQVFGAIGFTEELPLHLHTRRLWAWRDEYGNEAFWCRRIGEAAISAGPRQVWPRVTARPGAAVGAAP